MCCVAGLRVVIDSRVMLVARASSCSLVFEVQDGASAGASGDGDQLGSGGSAFAQSHARRAQSADLTSTLKRHQHGKRKGKIRKLYARFESVSDCLAWKLAIVKVLQEL